MAAHRTKFGSRRTRGSVRRTHISDSDRSSLLSTLVLPVDPHTDWPRSLHMAYLDFVLPLRCHH